MGKLNTLYNYEIPKNGTKVKLLDMNGNEYEKVVQEAGALAKARDFFCFRGFNDPITRVCFRAGKT